MNPPESRLGRQAARQRAISDAVMSQGSVRIEDLADRFGISVMTVHRDLDELESRGLLRKERGVATAQSNAMIESSDLFRASRQIAEKEAVALAATEFVSPGQTIILDDSTTVFHMLPHLRTLTPLTVISNTITILNDLRGAKRISLVALGGEYEDWCSSFMGSMTKEMLAHVRADVLFMSTSAIVDDVAFHQTTQTVEFKRAMFDSAFRRILLADHTKFDRRATHAMIPLDKFDAVVVDSLTRTEDVERLRKRGIEVIVARRAGAATKLESHGLGDMRERSSDDHEQ